MNDVFPKSISELEYFYSKVPLEHQRFKDEFSVDLNRLQHEYTVALDKISDLEYGLAKEEKRFNKLDDEYKKLKVEYEKLNKKLNNELI